jgi:hypothetical protein
MLFSRMFPGNPPFVPGSDVTVLQLAPALIVLFSASRLCQAPAQPGPRNALFHYAGCRMALFHYTSRRSCFLPSARVLQSRLQGIGSHSSPAESALTKKHQGGGDILLRSAIPFPASPLPAIPAFVRATPAVCSSDTMRKDLSPQKREVPEVHS